MKNIISIVFLIVNVSAFAQNTTEIAVYTASNGHVFKPGDVIQLGVGSNSNKDFVFVYTSPTSLIGKVNLPSNFSGNTLPVKAIKSVASKKIGTKTYLICTTGGPSPYWCDIEPAILTGEVIAK